MQGLLAFLDAGPKDHHITLSHKRPRGSSSPPKSKGLLLVSVYILGVCLVLYDLIYTIIFIVILHVYFFLLINTPYIVLDGP